MSIPLRQLHQPQSQRAPQQQQEDLFHYQALESQNTFRLLKLHRGQGDKIDCSIHHHTLGSETCPDYRAISYTWGKDAARFNISLPDDSVIKVRENLSNALRAVRDVESDCWLWIDAICINQISDTERNHQVRLMADIYGSANVVLVWLESVGESADVTRAFKFVHNAAAYEDSEHSVYKYSRAQISNSERERNWLAVENLCKLRYWTRKWIIQELVTARTVVLQAGNSKCTMADFETFCHQLHQNKDTVTYKQLSNTRPEICSVVVASPAARLALQRTETNNQQQPRLLHELIERYASSECHDPCDHIYALYSLAGEHRRHLSIEYAASPVRRLVMVLHFVHTHERMQPSKVLEFTNLLMRLFKIRPDDFLQERGLSENLDLVVPATLLGTVELQPETQGSMAMRREVKPLHPMSSFVLDTSRDIWVLTVNDDPAGSQERVGRDDMRYFSIADSGFHGLAACRLEAGDTIWHFPTTHLVFAVRSSSDHRAAVVGRAYLFSVTSNPDAPEPWLRRPFDYNRVRQGERNISMSLARLLEISSLAMSTKEVKLDPKKNVKRSGLRNMRIRWPLKMKTSWPMTDVKVLISIFLLAVILTQVIKR